MIVSAQFRLGGFYSRLAGGIVEARVGPGALLALLIAAAGLLSAVLVNDVVCLAMAPILVEGCSRRGLNPVPYLLGLACASNVGSAATLIGNPQNMLIGQVLHLSFTALPAAGGGAVGCWGWLLTWLVIRWTYRGRWHVQTAVAARRGAALQRVADVQGPRRHRPADGGLPHHLLAARRAGAERGRAAAARAGAWRPAPCWRPWTGTCWCSSAGYSSSTTWWRRRACSGRCWAAVRGAGVDVAQPGWLFGTTVVLSNLVSNVPATMLLLPVATYPLAGPILALASTLAGNLLIVGSIANIIVVDQAQRLGVRITWWEHAKVGVPVAAATLLVAAGWLYLVSVLGA